MKKLLALSVIGTSLILGSNSIRADENYFFNYGSNSGNTIYEILKSSVSGSTNQLSVITTFNRSANGNIRFGNDMWVDH